jgi:hypothetical protein
MKRTSIFFVILYFSLTKLYSQNARQVNVRNVTFNLNSIQKIIEINYDIEYNTPEDSIYILVQNKKGNKFKASALSGDIGLGVKPGQKKKIDWDFIKDSLRVNEEIAITIIIKQSASYVAQSNTVNPKYDSKATKDPIANTPITKVEEKVKVEKVTPIKQPKEKGTFNSKALITLAAGVLGGGYLAYSGNQKSDLADKYYESYKSNNWNQTLRVTTDSWLTAYSDGSIEKSNRMLQQANETKKTGQIMLYSGIGIIVADAVLTIPRLRKRTSKKVAFNPYYNPLSNSISLSLNYKFK